MIEDTAESRKIFANNLKRLMAIKNVDRLTLCKDLNFKYSTVSEWISGNKYPRIDKIEMLAKYFDVQKSDLIEQKEASYHDNFSFANIRPVQLKKFRLLGEIACGKPIFADEQHDAYIEASSDIRADFCLIAKGDSMINARIYDGDVVFIREQPIAENGEIAAVIIDDEATLKRWYYYPEKHKLMLVAENPKYEPLVYMGEELNEVRCLGKAVCFMSNL